MLGARLERPDLIAIFVVLVFASVLVHELGHAVVGRVFGLTPQIELHGMGGRTTWLGEQRELGHGRSIAISAAGPLAGLAVAAALYGAAKLGLDPHSPHAMFALQEAILINYTWSLFNLLPMLPLDGGNVVRSAINGATKGRGDKAAHVVSIVTGGLLVAWALLTREVWLGAFAAYFVWMNVQAFRHVDARRADVPLAQAIDKAYLALERHDGAEAIALLRPAIVQEASPDLRAIGLRIYSYALLLEGMWDELLPMLEENARLIGAEEITRYATTARELGRAREADRIDALVPRPRAANDFG